ncbi:ATP-binding protein [Nocardioides rotundus]|uniref:GTPase domain-containing protein n=1 Tax=Nocardioides rotundus TaxID=1774216 RepID=UPI001CBE0A0D|nr:GTPase domain-containing protein [Nocardioides rotundus]UAL30464.1 ATP-binding protein [Nocardioides rotundus]
MTHTGPRTPRGSLARNATVGSGMLAGVITAFPGGAAALSKLFRRRYPTVAVTGMTGVGKTALADRLTRHTTPEGPLDVGSATLERRTRRSSKLRGFRFRVVPGENAATRLGALDQVFHDEPVAGVLHVVANGYATPRRAGGISGQGVATREEQLAAELEDFSITAHRVASMAVRRDHPTWLIVAVTKADLYPGDIDEVVRYYSPGGDSPFARKLEELRSLTGGAKLSIDVLPVCAQGGGRKSPMPTKQCGALISALETRMAQLSGHI